MDSVRKVLSGLMLLTLLTALSVGGDPEPAAGGDDAKWLVNDAEIVFKVNVKQVMNSELMKKGGIEAIKQMIETQEQVKSILEATKLDVTKDLDSILASGKGANPKDVKVRFVVRGNFDVEKIHAALAKRSEIKMVKDGATTLIEIPGQDQPMFGAFVDKNVLVVTQDKASTIDAVKTGGKKAATMKKEMQSAWGKFTGKESMAMAMVVNDELRKAVQGTPKFGEPASKLQMLTAALTLTNQIQLNVRGVTGDSKSADKLKDLLSEVKGNAAAAGDALPPPLMAIINAIKIAADKESVKIDLQLTKEMIDKVSKG